MIDVLGPEKRRRRTTQEKIAIVQQSFEPGMTVSLNRPGFPGECFICELRLPDHRFRWKHNKLFLLLPEEYGPAFPEPYGLPVDGLRGKNEYF